jgi:hypothetical protein
LVTAYIPDYQYDILVEAYGKAYLDYQGIKPERENQNPKLYVCMPLVSNVPQPKDSDWEPTVCPECGSECWKRPIPDELRQTGKELIEVCTKCTLKHVVQVPWFK